MSLQTGKSTTRLDPQRYFELLDADTERLLAAAARDLGASVAPCPGWTVADVVDHVASVYEHKIRVMAENAWPSPWPPETVDARPALHRLADAKAGLFAEFANHQLDETTTTFSAADSTIGFWLRRMALEVAVHRYDAEVAVAVPTPVPTPVPDDLALDGIDEILEVMLGGPWWADRVSTRHPVDAIIAVASAGHRWSCDVRERSVTISAQSAAVAAAGIEGDPMQVFLWLWGRAADDGVSLEGDRALIAEFRARLAECTG